MSCAVVGGGGRRRWRRRRGPAGDRVSPRTLRGERARTRPRASCRSVHRPRLQARSSILSCSGDRRAGSPEGARSAGSELGRVSLAALAAAAGAPSSVCQCVRVSSHSGCCTRAHWIACPRLQLRAGDTCQSREASHAIDWKATGLPPTDSLGGHRRAGLTVSEPFHPTASTQVGDIARR